MKNKIVILTATRAEYGLLKTVIRKLRQISEFEILMAVTGAHLSAEFGHTYQEIVEDGIEIDRKIEILLNSDSPSAISKTMGLALFGFADYFEEVQPDALVVLGDRYETLAVCCAAMNARIPIIHLYGGETTEGAVDEAIRHAITKMSYLHFTSTEQYRRRVIQLGEEPHRVFSVGAIGIENILNTKLLTRQQLEDDMTLDLQGEYALVTFHPVTLENNTVRNQAEELIKAMAAFTEIKFIITKANADAGGKEINQIFAKYSLTYEHLKLVDSLGMVRYLSALKYASMVIGNSSSGLVEAPSFHIPTINIGDRQKGRCQAQSVLNCLPIASDIISNIRLARTENIRTLASQAVNPYGDGHTSDKIVEIIKEILLNSQLELKKKFYDLEE